MKVYSAFPKSPALLEPHHQIFLSLILDTFWVSYFSAEKQSMYSTVPADRAKTLTEAVYISNGANTLGKGGHPTISIYGQTVGQTGFVT